MVTKPSRLPKAHPLLPAFQSNGRGRCAGRAGPGKARQGPARPGKARQGPEIPKRDLGGSARLPARRPLWSAAVSVVATLIPRAGRAITAPVARTAQAAPLPGGRRPSPVGPAAAPPSQHTHATPAPGYYPGGPDRAAAAIRAAASPEPAWNVDRSGEKATHSGSRENWPNEPPPQPHTPGAPPGPAAPRPSP